MNLRLIKELRPHGNYTLECIGYGLEPYTIQFKINSWIPVYCLCIGRSILYSPLNMSDSRYLCPRSWLRLIKELRAHVNYILGCRGYGLEPYIVQLTISSWIPVYYLCIGRSILYSPMNMSDSWFLCPRMGPRLIKELRAHGIYILGYRGYGLEPCSIQFTISSWIPVYCLCIGRNIFYIPLHVSESQFLCPRMRPKLG